MILEAEAFAEIVSQNEAAIEEKLFKAVQESMYSNKMRVAPRRLRQIVHEEITALRSFLAQPETAQVQARGQQLAEETLGGVFGVIRIQAPAPHVGVKGIPVDLAELPEGAVSGLLVGTLSPENEAPSGRRKLAALEGVASVGGVHPFVAGKRPEQKPSRRFIFSHIRGRATKKGRGNRSRPGRELQNSFPNV